VHLTLCRFAGALALCLCSVAAARGQARIEDCETIQAADAYNQCLAKFGPTSKVKSVEPVKPGDIKDSSAEAAASAAAAPAKAKVAARHASRGRVVRGHGRRVAHAGKRPAKKVVGKAAGGRQRMTFVIKRRK